jgi:NADPH:quinone reductase
VDTLALNSVEGVHILDSLACSFESGALKPFRVVEDHVFPLEKAADAYRLVFNGAQHRVLLKLAMPYA